MIEVGVRVENRGDRQPELPDLAQDALVGATRIDDDGLPCDGISQDRAIASERRHGKRFPDEVGHGGVCSNLLFLSDEDSVRNTEGSNGDDSRILMDKCR